MRVPFVIIALAFLVSCNKLNQWSPAGVHAAEPPAKWFKTEIPLSVFHDETKGLESASANGFWQSISSDRDKQLVFPIAVKISCDLQEKICREIDATVQLGILQADSVEYDVTSWTRTGIVADDLDRCNRHSLAIDFKANSVTVTDYPIRATSGSDVACRPLHEAYSYALHGGELQLYPPAPWDPLQKSGSHNNAK